MSDIKKIRLEDIIVRLEEHHYTEPRLIKCPRCGSADVMKYGVREGIQEYLCSKCKRKFTARDLPFGMRTPIEQVGASLTMYYNGLSLADIVLPTNTFMERNDIANGVGLAFYGYAKKAIESLGESKSHFEIAALLASHLGISNFSDKTEEEQLREAVENSEIPDYDEFKQTGIYRINLSEPYVAFKKQIEDPENNAFPTPSGKIEIYSQQWAELNRPEIPPIPKYLEETDY